MPPRSYNGDKPFIFASYAHKDSALVVPAIEAMQRAGYRIWYDLGIEAGTEWSNNIAAHLGDCAVFIAFISKNSVVSENCLDEIAFAKSHKKPSLMIFLEEDVTLPQGTEMQTARFQRMYFNRQQSFDQFVHNLTQSPVLEPCRDFNTDVTMTGAPPMEAPPAAAPVAPPVAPPSTAAPKKSKLPLWIGIGVGAAVLIALLCIVLPMFKPAPVEDDTSSAVTDNTEAEQPEVAVEMSDDIKDFTFLLNNKVYKLPFAFTTLVEDGWTISSSYVNSETQLAGQSTESVQMSKDGANIGVTVYNDTGNTLAVSKSQIVGIEIDGNCSASFEIAGGITPLSTADEIIAVYGTPNSRNDSDEYVSLQYNFDDSYNSKVSFYVYLNEDDWKYNTVSLKNIVVGNTQTETNEEAPSFLAEYKAPTSLGEDILSGIVEIEGDLYQIPAPVSAFLNNGWTFTSQSGAVVAGDNDYITVKRDNKEISLSIYNGAEYQTIPENCVVTAVTVYAYDEINIVLPGDITISSPKENLIALLPGEDTTIDETYISYYEYGDRPFDLYCSLNDEGTAIDSIKIACEDWNY